LEFSRVNISSFRRRAFALAAAGTLVLAACGDDDDTSTATTADSGAATTAAPDTTGATATTGGSDATTATTEGGADTTPAGSTAPMEPVSGTLVGSGATSQAAAMQAWTVGFQQGNPDATVQYDPVGSGGGRTAFLSGGADFAGSDAALSDDDFAKSKDRCGADGAVDLPHYISPIAIAYNLPGVDTLKLTPETAAGIFAGKITKWNDAAIAADNSGVDLPDTAINPVHRSDESGTTQNFTDYLHATAPDVWTEEAAQDWPEAAGGEGAQGTSGVVAAIGAGEGSVGYADASQVGELGIAQIKVGDAFVELSPEAAAKAVEVSDKVPGRNQYDVSFKLNRTTTEAGVYPITLVSYHIVCLTYDDQAKADLVKSFMAYVGSQEGQDAAAQAAGSAPMTAELQKQVATAVEQISAG
jgi:phosphate transport system substrate-binding protein